MKRQIIISVFLIFTAISLSFSNNRASDSIALDQFFHGTGGRWWA